MEKNTGNDTDQNPDNRPASSIARRSRVAAVKAINGERRQRERGLSSADREVVEILAREGLAYMESSNQADSSSDSSNSGGRFATLMSAIAAARSLKLPGAKCDLVLAAMAQEQAEATLKGRPQKLHNYVSVKNLSERLFDNGEPLAVGHTYRTVAGIKNLVIRKTQDRKDPSKTIVERRVSLIANGWEFSGKIAAQTERWDGTVSSGYSSEQIQDLEKTLKDATKSGVPFVVDVSFSEFTQRDENRKIQFFKVEYIEQAGAAVSELTDEADGGRGDLE